MKGISIYEKRTHYTTLQKQHVLYADI